MLFLSFLASSLSSCQDEISDASGTWVCMPEPDASITLTFRFGYVSTNLDIPYSPDMTGTTMPSGKSCVFSGGDQFTVRGNKLYTFDPMGLTPPYPVFIGTMLSFNKMSLHYVGELDDSRLWVIDYIFERK